MKQEFSLEKLRVRTFRRLRNVFSLCVVAYLFVTRYLRASLRFRGIVKAIRDNCTEQSLTTHPLLANLRSLIGEERIRNITGRPRKPPEKEPDQLEFVFRSEARTAWAESLDRFWDSQEIFFAQCFQGSREDSG